MKKQSGFLRRSIILALSLLCILTALTAVSFAADIISYGYCGEGKGPNLYWELDSDGILTISGTGKMADFGDDSNYCPWEYFSNDIKSVNIQNGATSIGSYAFAYCRNLSSITIPDSVTVIGEGAFKRCTSITSITIPYRVTSIGPYAFVYCDSLSSITVPDSVAVIGEGAFQRCISLTGISIPYGVTRIEDESFLGCISLADIVIPNSVTSIGKYAFGECSGLTSITIGTGVRSIERSSFGCHILSSIRVIAGNTVYDSRNNCNAIIETQTNTLILG